MIEKGFLGTIFDFSFTEFVTTKVIKFLLGLAIVVNAIITIVMIVNGFNNSAILGIVILILSPVVYLVLMLFSRIYLELIIVIFRIAENLIAIREKLGSGGEGPQNA
ncbi:MAG: DUF4282 domain-containing protein [PVC group bacterium]